MPQQLPKSPADYIVPLNINGLDGRLLHVPAPKGKANDPEIMFVYGHHSSLERWWGVAQVLNRYGAVTVPDLPGFGGMDSLYTIGRKPTIDNLADYLAAFIKLRYKRKKVIIAGMSFGFVIVTRMLQRYPELTKKVVLLVSIVGFAHKDDFTFSWSRYHGYMFGCQLFSRRLPAAVFRHTALQPWVLRTFYGRTHNAKHKFAQANDAEDLKRLQDVEIGLWHDNDVRTWAFTTIEFLRFDNCKVRVDLPLWHVAAKADHFFDEHVVEQHMRVIFKEFHSVSIDVTNHAPSVIADAKEAAPLFPVTLRRKLTQLIPQEK
ncbi:MAG TPA: alpha/beta hydrolase [Candidatus Saccharimonadales bacterium]|nr:alpha/beta hydrolase [Candidatus Saccharimonadales bacterium]